MTEEDAKTKWCPKIQVLVTPQDTVWQGLMMTNRAALPASEKDVMCIASDCACWVWDGEMVTEEGLKSEGHCGLSR